MGRRYTSSWLNVGRKRARRLPRKGQDRLRSSLDRGMPGCRVRSGGAFASRCSRDRRGAPRRRAFAPASARVRGRPCRASCSRSSTPERSTGWPLGCRPVSRSSRRRTARRRPPRWPPRSSAPALPPRAQPLGGEPRLRRRRPPCSQPADAELGLLEVDEGALPEVAAARPAAAVCLGNLFRDQLDRYGELELVADRWREAVARLAQETEARRERRRPAGRIARRRARRTRSSSASTTRAVARPALQHAADSKYCVRCGTPYEYAAAYVGHLGDYRCPHCGHARPAARRGRPVDRARTASSGAAFDLVTPAGTRGSSSRCPGSTTSTTRLRRRRSPRRSARRSTRSPRGSAGSAPRSAASSASPSAASAAPAPDQESRGRERGRPHARRRRPAARRRRRAERRDRRRPRRLVDLGRRLRAAARRTRHVVATGERAAELALRFDYGGARRVAHRRRARRLSGARPRPRADAGRRRARRAPDVHRDARAAAHRRRRAAWQSAIGSVRHDDDPRRPPLSRVPQHLRRPRQHRRLRAASRAGAATSST